MKKTTSMKGHIQYLVSQYTAVELAEMYDSCTEEKLELQDQIQEVKAIVNYWDGKADAQLLGELESVVK